MVVPPLSIGDPKRDTACARNMLQLPDCARPCATPADDLARGETRRDIVERRAAARPPIGGKVSLFR
jgi:hypothetical protein